MSELSNNGLAGSIAVVVGLLSWLVRWAITQVTTAMTASTEARIAHAAALAKQAEAFTFLREKVDDVHEWCLKTPAQGHRRAKTEPKGNPT